MPEKKRPFKTGVYIFLHPVGASSTRLQDDGRRRYEEPRRHGVWFRVHDFLSLGFRVGLYDLGFRVQVAGSGMKVLIGLG